MDNAGLTPNSETLTIIETILRDLKDGRSGVYGELVGKIWSMEMANHDAVKLKKWRDVLRQRLGISAAESKGGIGFAESRRDDRGLNRRIFSPMTAWKGRPVDGRRGMKADATSVV